MPSPRPGDEGLACLQPIPKNEVIPVKKACFSLILLLAVLCLLPAAAEEDPFTLGRTFTGMFFSGAVDNLWERFTPPLQDVFGSAAGFSQFQAEVVGSFDTHMQFVHDQMAFTDEWYVYQAALYFAAADLYAAIQWAFTAEGVIGGLYITVLPQEAPSDFLDYQTKTELRLPFAGEWYVFWGGRSIGQNYHAADRAQRFAVDFAVQKDGLTYKNSGLVNEDYYAFGLPIFAPGEGRVLAAVDGVPDNLPGEMNPDEPLGNYIIIDHQNGEYSFLAHFQQGSIAAAEGDWVNQGDFLGLCGNSGNSSEPHLHYHLQNTPQILTGQGLPAQFRSYLANGEFVEVGEPLRGELVTYLDKTSH
jgi:murein DD-endopeptidase MepM/ murein hydrolase activator NlpD